MLFCFFFFYSVIVVFIFFFFFSSRRRHTRFDCDWSSTCALPICLSSRCGRWLFLIANGFRTELGCAACAPQRLRSLAQVVGLLPALFLATLKVEWVLDYKTRRERCLYIVDLQKYDAALLLWRGACLKRLV